MLSICLVTLVALLMGFRPVADPVSWQAVLGVIVSFTFALTWAAVVFGLVGKTPAGANSLSLIFQLLSFTSSALVRPDLMSGGIRWFAGYQPFTPVIDTVRGLLLDTSIGKSALLAVVWCGLLTLVGYLGALAMYNRNPGREVPRPVGIGGCQVPAERGRREAVRSLR
jgi:ABC-2 type transport system permease protein